jgi:transcriptional regulator with XRE-family HTH domain
MDDKKKLPLPERLRERRAELGWTQPDVVNEVKRRFGVTVRANHLSQCETGAKAPSLTLLAMLAQVLETSTDYLLGVTNNKLSIHAIEETIQAGGTGGLLNQVIARLPRDKQAELVSVAEAYIYRNMMDYLLNEIEEAGGDVALNSVLDKLESSLPGSTRRLRPGTTT